MAGREARVKGADERMERGEVRKLTDEEIADLVKACMSAPKREEVYMSHRVFDLSLRAAATGDAILAETYRFLSGVLTPSVESIAKIESAGNPFWVAPSTLTDVEVSLLRQLVDTSTDPELRARFADFVWLAVRDWTAGETAVDAYMDSARRLRDPEEWTGSAPRYERAASLAGSLGRKKPRYAAVIAEIEAYLAELDATDPLFMSVRLMEILLAHKAGDRTKYAALAEKGARAAEARGNLYVAQFHWDLAAKWHAAAKNDDGVRTARTAAAETQVKEAESRTTGANASFLAAASILQGAIVMLQRAGGTEPRIQELFRQLKEYESRGVGELKPIGATIDLSDVAQIAREDVEGKSFPDAINALAAMVRLPRRDSVRAAVLKAANAYPMQHMFGAALLDGNGALIAGRGSVDPDEEKDDDRAVLALMYEDVIRTFSVTALGQIDPARLQIRDEHDIRELDLSVIVDRSWFVPPGRESLFVRGLHAGFDGDFVFAIHILTPQIEAAIRWNLRRRGHVTTRLNRDHFQEEMDLNQLLAMDASRELLGEDLQFAFRALLTSRFGFNLRNKLAHGLMDVGSMHSSVSEYFWALELMLCVRATSASDGRDRQ